MTVAHTNGASGPPSRTPAQAMAAFELDRDLYAARQRLGEAMPTDGWLGRYLRAVTPLSDVPVEFSLVSGMATLGTALGNSLWIETWGQQIYPHLWAVLVAPSSFWRKSTAINMAERLMHMADHTMVLPSDFSKEKLMEELSARAVGMLSIKEFGGFLASMGKDYMCVDAETEALTTTGWKRHDELQAGDVLYGVATSGPTTLLRTAPVLAVNRYQVVDEPMVSIEGRSTSQMMTANHTVVLQNARRRPRADELQPHDRLLQVARWGAGFGTYGQSGTAADKRRVRGRAALLGWFLAEGWIEGRSVLIGQKDDRPALERAMDDSGFAWRARTPRPDGLVTYVVETEGSAWLLDQAPGKVPDHALLQSWSRKALTALWDAFMAGDGYFGKRSDRTGGEVVIRLTQNPGSRLDFIQALALRLGYRTVATPNNDTMSVSISRYRSFELSAQSMTTVQYTGTVWCPTTELGTFVARRRGRVFITGNSGTKEMLTDLYDGPLRYTRALKSRTFTIERPSITILGATTLDWLESRVTDGDIRGGFLGRFLFVTAAEKSSDKGLTGGMDGLEQMRLMDALRELRKMEPRQCYLTAPALQLWERWMKRFQAQVEKGPRASDLSGFAVRLQTYALKFSMIHQASLAVDGDEDRPAISPVGEAAMTRSLAYCGYLWANVSRMVGEDIAITREARELRRLREMVPAEGITRSALLRTAHMSARSFDQVMETLMQTGEITTATVTAADLGIERKRQRATVVYRKGVFPTGNAAMGVFRYGSPNGSTVHGAGEPEGSYGAPSDPPAETVPGNRERPVLSTESLTTHHFTHTLYTPHIEEDSGGVLRMREGTDEPGPPDDGPPAPDGSFAELLDGPPEPGPETALRDDVPATSQDSPDLGAAGGSDLDWGGA